MAAIHAVIFDLDDTLYPEREYVFSGFDAVAVAFQDRLGDPGAAVVSMRRLFDTEHRPRVFNTALAEKGVDDAALLDAMIETYRSHRPAISLHPDANEILTRLRPDYKLGVITDGRSVSQWNKIDALDLRGRVDKIIVTDDLGAEFAKPHPQAFELMAEGLGVEHAACVYVADNPAKDFVAPNALGWLTVRIIRPDGIYGDVPVAADGHPRHTVTTLADLRAVLAGS